MASTLATHRSITRPSPPKKVFKGSHTEAVLPPGDASPWHRDPSRGKRWRQNKKVYNAKSGKLSYQYSQNDNHSNHDVLLGRLSQPSSPSSLLERIEGASSDPILEDRSSEEVEEGADADLPVLATPHFYTPEPGEVERFLESVIGPPPAPPIPVYTCPESKPSLELETHNLPVGPHSIKIEETPSSVLYSPTHTAVNNLPPATPLERCQPSSKLLGVMSTPPTSAFEECKELLVPVLAAASKARYAGSGRLSSEQCFGLLSNDHCADMIQKAKEMRSQISSLLSQKTPVNEGWSRIPKRDRDDDKDEGARSRNRRGRFDTANTSVFNVSERDCDSTVDVSRARTPSRAPRAMLQGNRALQINPSSDHGAARSPTLVGSPTTEPQSTLELAHQATKLFPTLMCTTQEEMEMDISDVSITPPTVEQSARPTPTASPPQPALSSTTDFVSHLSTEPGIWFRQRGRRFAEIVDVDVEVSDEMFYSSADRRLRTPLRLCSVPVGAFPDGASLQAEDVHRAVESHVTHVTQWPKKGKVIVQVNPDSERRKTWLPHVLTSDPLDVTACIRPGKNVFRFIQLSDLSEFVFVLVASPPPREEAWRSVDWASLVVDAYARSSSSSAADDDPTSLSEFAQIPITIRS